jgi:hypothetical protein
MVVPHCCSVPVCLSKRFRILPFSKEDVLDLARSMRQLIEALEDLQVCSNGLYALTRSIETVAIGG